MEPPVVRLLTLNCEGKADGLTTASKTANLPRGKTAFVEIGLWMLRAYLP